MRRALVSSSIVLCFIMSPGSIDSRAQNGAPPKLLRVVVNNLPRENGDAQKVFIDPVTKRPRQPTAEELQALRDSASPGPRVVRELHFVGGGVIQEMEMGVYEDQVVAHLEKDGTITMRCVRHGVDHGALVTRPATAAAPRPAEVK
jgi:hypothetical protein